LSPTAFWSPCLETHITTISEGCRSIHARISFRYVRDGLLDCRQCSEYLVTQGGVSWGGAPTQTRGGLVLVPIPARLLHVAEVQEAHAVIKLLRDGQRLQVNERVRCLDSTPPPRERSERK
jgi:hypothetical protein